MHRVDLLARPGCYFEPETGKLYEYDGADVTVFFGWPEMVAFRRQVLDDDWKAIQPRLSVPPFDETSATGSDDEARGRYWQNVPAAVRRAIAPYPDGHWRLLAWMARTGDAAQDLILSNASLAFAVAHYREFRSKRGRPVEAYAPPLLVYEKQRQILGWLGFPPTEAARHILQKIEHRAISASPLLALRPRLVDPEVRQRLAHLPRIDETLLAMAADGALLSLTPRLLGAIARRELDEPDARALALMGDVARMWRQLHARARLPIFHQFARIGELHDRLAEETNREAAALPANVRFAGPPVPGTDSIIPLITRGELIEEGRMQNNCVASYAPSVARGHRAIYRVLMPERATLSLVRRRDGWRIEQLKGPRNRSVAGSTRAVIEAWLNARRRNVRDYRLT